MSLHRVHERFEYSVPVQVSHGEKTYFATSVNFSVSGVLLRVGFSIPPETIVDLSFHLPNQKEETRCKAMVKWASPDQMGLQFTEIDPENAKAIEGLLQKNISKNG